MILDHFYLDSSHPRYLIWGLGNDERFYFKEWLPAFFSRELDFTDFSNVERFIWMFSGRHGRIELCWEKQNIILRQIYTDSFSLYRQDPFTSPGQNMGRHPERVFCENTVAVQEMTSLRLDYDCSMELRVYVNGRNMLHQHSILDVSQHQLSLHGENSIAAGTLLGLQPVSACPGFLPNQFHQKMLGFGGIASAPAYQELSETGKKKWWKYIREYNLLIQREYPSRCSRDGENISWDDMQRAVPHYYGNNFPVGEISDFTYNKTIQDMGGSVWFEFWLYPDIVYKDGCLDVRRLADLILDYCRAAREKTGYPPEIAGIQNERCETAENLKEIVAVLRQKLDQNGFASVKLSTCNAPYLKDGAEYLERFQKDQHTWDCVDYSASNMYDYQQHMTDMDSFDDIVNQWNAQRKGKTFLSTEICVNESSFQEDSYHIAFATGLLYHKNLVKMDAAAICYCWTLLDVTEPSYAYTRTLFTVDQQHGFVPAPGGYILRVFGSFSRHIMRGMRRVEMAGGNPDILCSAYLDDSRQTFIFLNSGMTSCTLDLKNILNDSSTWNAELSDPYHENDSVALEGKRYPLAPGAILTVYC
jgi:hypothetical protein